MKHAALLSLVILLASCRAQSVLRDCGLPAGCGMQARAAPELDPASALGAITLLAGLVVIVRGKR